MRTTTELANRALTILGEMRISNIDDTEDRSARLCKAHVDEAILEAIRPHKWTCATDRIALSEVLPAPVFGWAHAFQLPEGFIRLLEVNGEEVSGSGSRFALEGKRLLLQESNCPIRYLKLIGVSDMDPLLKAAVAAKLASLVAIPLTGNATLRKVALDDYRTAVGEATRVNAIEVGSRANNGLINHFTQSILLGARRGRSSRNFPR